MKLKNLNKELPITDMCKIGRKHKTDKPGYGYTKVYHEIMKDFRNKSVSMFEIGIYFGASLRMWHEYFSKGFVCGIDNGRLCPGSGILVGGMDGTRVNVLSVDDVKLLQPEAVTKQLDFSWIENERLKCFIADQRSETQLNKAFKYFQQDEFNFILDDGQHYQEHQQKTLGILFPNIISGGYYIIEDVVEQQQLIEGSLWGQRKKDATDSTDYIFKQYIKSGELKSRYITESQTKYITDNIEDIFLYDNLSKNNSPINGSSKLLIIKKK